MKVKVSEALASWAAAAQRVKRGARAAARRGVRHRDGCICEAVAGSWAVIPVVGG